MHQFFFFFVFCFVLFGSVYSQLDIHVASCIVSAPDLFGVGCKLPLRDACLRCVVCHELHPPCVNNPRIVKDQFGYSVIRLFLIDNELNNSWRELNARGPIFNR